VSWPLLLAIAALTYASRAVSMVLLPRPRGWVEATLGRTPAPLFASLAAPSLLGDGGGLAGWPTMGAAAGALLLSPARSLPLCLVGGLAGYAVATLLVR
jgi:branched-subunit amino acid transport protein